MLNIFQQPWTLLTASVLSLFIILIIRRVQPEKRHFWQLLLPILIASAAFGLDFFVKTDAELISEVVQKIAKAAQNEDPEAIEPLIAREYRDSFHRSKDNLMRHCKSRLSETLIEKAIARIVSIDVRSPKASAVFTVRLVFDKQSRIAQYQQQMFVEIKVELQKGSGSQWEIGRLEIVKINRQPANWRFVPR